MKNRIWKQMKKVGIVTVLTGVMLGGTIEPKLILGADFLSGQVPFIDQSVFWKDRESGQAELGIRIRGLNEWLSGRRFSEDKEKNEKWDDELQETEDPSVEQEEETEQELPEDDWQKEETEQELPEDDWQKEETEQELPEDDWQKEEETEQELTEDGWQKEETEQELPVNKVVEGIGIEMEEGYEHVEQLASGETVQPEDEEQEKTGPLTPKGTASGEENVGDEEEYESEEIQKLTLVTYISEYFVPETDSVPKNMAAQQISVRSQSGEATEITKLKIMLNVEQDGQDEIFFRIPLILRQEYRFPAEKSSYPVTQEEPLQKDCTSAGTFLLTEENGEELVIAEGISPMLDVEAAEADMELSVTAQNEKMKAGQTIRYQVEIANTGKLDLADIRLTSSLSCPKIRQMWEDAEGLLTEGAVAEFAELKAGESRSFYVQAPLLDEQEKDLEHQVEAEARVKGRAAEVIRKNATTINSLEALKADLSVKKTADKETAAPGETVTYQICIVNTGEKTLHSVVGTERFQAAGIHAQFLEQEGVTLNSSRTKAMIQQIPPGEAVSLQAVVKIPERTADQKLFNQVTVTSQETGERSMEASASVIVKGKVTVTPEERLFLQSDDQDPASGQTQMARAASTHPKTEDDTRTDLWTLLAVTALVTVMGGIWLRKKYADIYEKS
ncbi:MULTISPECIES: DUF11 domain-containing protein [Clostridia]|uniref:DUF7507 domain-containing protein n=1 Tax=Clostridia TaxID=186801 RepID=UPI000E51D50F|nr:MULTISPECIES: DUF11 domain-containing protein [Clostridia]MCJ7860075.1 DUF11 domain-containing protein [Blautia sp. NSJ-157]MCJ7863267.1 DUF11 domain-containing protein [Blautia sp. NSJ-140]RHR09693.1 DUF11 domain-containing protein [Ruminococcus sp. AF20-12LB]